MRKTILIFCIAAAGVLPAWAVEFLEVELCKGSVTTAVRLPPGSELAVESVEIGDQGALVVLLRASDDQAMEHVRKLMESYTHQRGSGDEKALQWSGGGLLAFAQEIKPDLVALAVSPTEDCRPADALEARTEFEKSEIEDVAMFGIVGETAIHSAPRPELNSQIADWVDEHLERLLEFYRERHQNPELALHEKESARVVAAQLRTAGYAVTTDVGGHGVVGILQNGEGPTVLIRGDMDALPIMETTGLPYASTVRAELADGKETGVMHACGHDIHMTNLVGTAAALAAMKEHWRGTVVIVGQPAEEIGVGAAAMISDGLFERFPKPDFCLGLHVSPLSPAGSLAYSSGWATANVDSVDITIFGHGGHGALPHQTIDPIVTTAQAVMGLQTLVSRRVDPVEGAVVTVGSIHAGSRHNIIPNEARLQLTVRSFSDEVRKTLLYGIREIVMNTCRAMGCPRDPEITVRDGEFTPSGYNDPALAAAAAEVMTQVVGQESVFTIPALTVGEDFSRYAREIGVPGLMFWLGSVNEKTFADAQAKSESLPSLHSSDYHPDPGPTLRTGIRTMSAIALSLLDSAP